jgi:DNA-binding transcriptional regulator GbsR (MarR family)
MGLPKNEGSKDRFFRFLFGIAFLLVAFFWFGGVIMISGYIVGAILIFSAATGFCFFYYLIGYSSYKKAYEEYFEPNIKFMLAIILVFLIVGVFASYFITKKIFLKDLEDLNTDYKKLWIDTRDGTREGSLADYVVLFNRFDDFYYKYHNYRPFIIKKSKEFGSSLDEIMALIQNAHDKIRYGNMSAAHSDMNKINLVFVKILKTNNIFTMKVYLADFYESFILFIEAAKNKDIDGVLKSYAPANEKLKLIEKKSKNVEVKNLRINLDSIESYAKKAEIQIMPSKAEELQGIYAKAFVAIG